MKMFQNVKENLASIDFSAGGHWYDFQILFHIVKCTVALGLQFAYLFCVAVTPEEIMISIFTTAVGVLVFVSYLSIIPEMAEIFYVIDKIERTVNKSKLENSCSIDQFDEIFLNKKSNLGLKRPILRAMYKNTRKNSEKVSKIVYFLIVHLAIPFVVLPRAILCYAIYYITDAGSDAFELPIPTW